MSRILGIEDDQVLGKVLKLALELAGHEVELATNVSAGRRALEAGGHDLVLLDLNLPDGHGFEVLRFLRQDLHRTTPVIVLSGLKQELNVVRGLELGADDYMTKPFSPRELVARVQRWAGA